jgi:hypothetical protein
MRQESGTEREVAVAERKGSEGDKKRGQPPARKTSPAISEPNAAEFLLKLLEEEWAQARQSEDQRAIMTNLLILIASATIGFLAEKGFTETSLPLAILLMVVGGVGALASAKYYERHQFHIKRAQAWRGELNELYEPYSNIEFDKVRKGAKAEHNAEHRIFSKVPLHYIWVVLHLLIVGAGIVSMVIILR